MQLHVNFNQFHGNQNPREVGMPFLPVKPSASGPKDGVGVQSEGYSERSQEGLLTWRRAV